MNRKLFTSESVSMGHPDKVCDQISDTILDACLREDPASRVACETFVTTGTVVVGGEITTSTFVDVQEEVRATLRDIGYTSAGIGFDADSCGVHVLIHSQSADIKQGVDAEGGATSGATGAGDQGMMFGYACRETEVLMPAPIHWAHRLVEKQAELRRTGGLPWLRPDAKAQVTFSYENDQPVGIEAVVLSTQTEDIDLAVIRKDVEEAIIREVLPSAWLHAGTKFHINPTGRFVVGGPHGDAGLTGVPSQAKTRPRSTVPPLMRHAGWRRMWSKPDGPIAAKYSWPTPSGLQSRSRSVSTPSAAAERASPRQILKPTSITWKTGKATRPSPRIGSSAASACATPPAWWVVANPVLSAAGPTAIPLPMAISAATSSLGRNSTLFPN